MSPDAADAVCPARHETGSNDARGARADAPSRSRSDDAGPSRCRRGTVRPLPVSLAVAVLVAAAAGGLLVGLPGSAPSGATPGVVVSLSVADDRLRFVNRGGRPLAVDDLRVHVVVDGTPLTHQPPVPFFSAPGFVSGPTGPFNPAGDRTWSPGETATLRVAATNRPRLRPGDHVAVTLFCDGRRVARVGATVSTEGPPGAVAGPGYRSVAGSDLGPVTLGGSRGPAPAAVTLRARGRPS